MRRTPTPQGQLSFVPKPKKPPSAPELALALGISVRSLHRYKSLGLPTDSRRRARAWVQEHIAARQEQTARKREQLLSWRETRSALMQLQLETKQGLWLDRWKVEQAWRRRVIVFKQKILALPASLASRLVDRSISEVNLEINKALEDAFDVFHQPINWHGLRPG